MCHQFFFIGDKTVINNANPMSLVHSILYCHCTRCIGFASIVTVLSPMKTKDYTHVFGPLCTICTTAYVKFIEKNQLNNIDICPKNAIFGPHKIGTRLMWTPHSNSVLEVVRSFNFHRCCPEAASYKERRFDGKLLSLEL